MNPPKRTLTVRKHRCPEPDIDMFVRRNSQWQLRFDLFVTTAASPDELRAKLAPAELKTFGAETPLDAIPDDLVVAAAAAGATVCIPFLDILDGNAFTRAPCLCCYGAHSARVAREAAAALRIFLQYYDADSYVNSRAYVRTVAALSRDLRPEELAEVRNDFAHLASTPDTVREINSKEGLCVVEPPCQPGVLWVYSTPCGRRLLRHLARGVRKTKGLFVKVTVASSNPMLRPRHHFRMYAATLLQPCGGTSHALVDTALAWVRTQH
jgi:hypothetical protein